MKLFTAAACVLCLFVQTLTAQSVSLSGMVVKDGGTEGVAGVEIVLANSDSLSTVTDAQGSFSITGSMPVQKTFGNGRLQLTLSGNELIISSREPVRGKVEVFAVDGHRTVTTSVSKISADKYTARLPGPGQGVRILRATINDEVFVKKILRLDNDIHEKYRAPGSGQDHQPEKSQRKPSAHPPPVDTLIAYKPGYREARVPVDTYEEQDILISLDTLDCGSDSSLNTMASRNFNMGFSTWAYGPDESDRNETYQFITQNADVYSEQVDHKIPWKALINNTELPAEFVAEIDDKVSRKITGNELLLSVSLLNSGRSDLLEDYDGTIPDYTSMDDSLIENAYYKHLEYLIGRFNPDYLVFAMEINDLRKNAREKWTQYKSLAANIRSRLKAAFPTLATSESVTLHNYFNPEVGDPDAFIAEISDYINQNVDFAAISYYPFFKGQHSKRDFQQAFDFLHGQINKPAAFVETTHLAETLEVESLNLVIPSDVCEQKAYLETLLLNAYENDYEFVIWWAFRDYDELWNTFPDESKDLGKLWRDTGLLNERGHERPAYNVWQTVLGQ